MHTGRQKKRVPEEGKIGRSITPIIFLRYLLGGRGACRPATPILNFDRQELSVIEAVYQDLVDKTSEYLLRFLIGSLSVDADWETYIDDLTRIGLLELEKAYQNAYGRRYP